MNVIPTLPERHLTGLHHPNSMPNIKPKNFNWGLRRYQMAKYLTWGLIVVLIALFPKIVEAQLTPTCLGLPPAQTVGWSNSTKILSYVPPSMVSNCGYLTMLMLGACNNNCTNARACCEAGCGWNSAGCGCFEGNLSALAADLPFFVPSSKISAAVTALDNSTCNLGTIYSGSTCQSLPATGSNICGRAKPAVESASCTSKLMKARINALTTAMEMLTFPASFNFSSADTPHKMKQIFSTNAQIALGRGVLYNNRTVIFAKLIGPKISAAHAGLLKASVSRGNTKFSGSYALVPYTVKVKDVKGVVHDAGTYYASATFANCSTAIEGLYLPKILTLNQLESYTTTFPRVTVSTTYRMENSTLGRRLMDVEMTDSAIPEHFVAASPWWVSAVHTIAPYIPFVQYDSTVRSPLTRRSLAESQPASSDSITPRSGTRNQNSTLASVGSGLVSGVNNITSSPAMQNQTYNFSNSTFVCPGSTLNNMQFCDGWSGSSTYDLSDTGIVSDTCTGLCADGAWDTIGNFACDYGCPSAVAASCQSCQAGCSAACSSCNSGCQATCSTCQGSVNAACSSCNVACCFGCQVCTPAVPESCCCGGCCCQTCMFGGCCCQTCVPDTCTPAIPGYCTSTQLCPNGACDSTCDVNANCGSVCDCSSACSATCNCNSACGSACDYNACPDCSVNCQNSCVSGLGSVGMEYSYSANLIIGMGGLNASGVLSSQTVSTYQANKTNPSANFDLNMQWQWIQVKVGFSATVTPSYGAPVIPWTYITTNVTYADYQAAATTFNVIQDCLPSASNNYNPTGKLSVSLNEFNLNVDWVPWQYIANVLQPWEYLFGSAWINDAAQAMSQPINSLLDNQAGPLVINLMNPQLSAYDWGTYACG